MSYRALTGMTLPVNEEEHKLNLAAQKVGKQRPFEERRTVRYEAGEVIDYIPESSAVWMLKQGHIEVVEEEEGREE